MTPIDDASSLGRGLYLITPEETSATRLLTRIAPVLPLARLVQYRNKTARPAVRLVQASALLALCRAAGVPMVVNDDAGLAARIGADGVHLGRDDGDTRAARKLLGQRAIVGASCYNELERARIAVEDGASYVAFGAFFPTANKPDAARADVSLLQDALPLSVPIVAIGGITPGNAPALIAAGADLLAVIGGVFDRPDPLAAARAYQHCFDQSQRP